MPGQNPAAPMTPQPPIADESSPNLAPAKPLQDAKKDDPYTAMDFLEIAKEIRKEYRLEKDSEEWRNRLLASQKNELYFKGLQKLRRATYSNNWRIEDPKPIHFTINEFQFWAGINASKWLASRADYRISGLSDTEDAHAAANKLEWISDYYDDRDWTRTVTKEAALQAQFTGHLVAYVYYDKNFAQRQAYIPVTERVTEKIGKDVYYCADCENVGPSSGDAATCEVCGSNRTVVTQTPEIEVDRVTGQEPVDVGDVTHELIPIYNLSWKAYLGPRKSPAILWEERHDKSALEARFPGLRLPRAANEDLGLAVRENLENAGRPTNKSEKDILTRLWIEPSAYKKYKLKSDVVTVAGETIPAGTPLEQRFRKGIHIIMVGDLIVDLYETSKQDDLCFFEYEPTPNGLAMGVDAACEPQRQLNTVKSLINLWMRHNAVPPMQYVAEIVDPQDVSGDPTKPYPIQAVNMGMFPGVTVENAVTYKVGQPLPPAIIEYERMLRNAIQFAFKATELSEGLPGVSNKTLGGAQISQSLAQGIYSSILAGFSDFKAEIIKRKLLKFKRHVWAEKFVQVAGDYHSQEGEYLSASDIPDDFEITPVPDSWSPRSPRQNQQNMQALLAAVGGPQGLAMTPAPILDEMCRLFDVELTDNSFPAAIRTARYRIKQAKKLLPALQIANQAIMQATGMPPMGEPQQPVSIGEQLFEGLIPAFNPAENGHVESIAYLRKWFLTDEGLEAPKEIIEFVNVLIAAHIQAVGLENQIKAQVSGPQMAPPALPPMPNSSAAAAVPVGG